MKIQLLRRSIQILVILLALNAGIGLARGWMSFGVERFCPFGGVETLWAVLTRQSFTCAMGPYNLSLMLALFGLTLVSRKSFCAWVCPVGTVNEWLGALGRRLRSLRERIAGRAPLGMSALPRRVDRPLRGFRIAVLAAVLLFTVGTGELIFRPYDPYYVLFSAHGHDVRVWSYLVVGGILLLAVILPLAWCRYLCPLGGALWPFSRFAFLRIARDDDRCSSCGHCDLSCPQGLKVSTRDAVHSGECTLCLECLSACPQAGSLSVRPAALPRLRVPAYAVLLLIVLAGLFGFTSAGKFSFASLERTYVESEPPADRIGFLSVAVAGVCCVDTATRAARQLEKVDGVVSLIAYAAEHRLDIRYDARGANAEAIIAGLEAPFWDAEAGEYLFNLFEVREVLTLTSPLDSEPLERSIDS